MTMSPSTGSPIARPSIRGLFMPREVFLLIETRPAEGVSPIPSRRVVKIQVKRTTFVGLAPVTQGDLSFVNKGARISSTGEVVSKELFAIGMRDLVVRQDGVAIRVALTLADLARIDSLTR